MIAEPAVGGRNMAVSNTRRESTFLRVRLRLAEGDASKLRTRLRLLEDDADHLRDRLRLIEYEMSKLRDDFHDAGVPLTIPAAS
jgi:hypothetical protein